MIPPVAAMPTRSSVSNPDTTSLPPPRLPSTSPNDTAASISCGVALTVFSAKVSGELTPLRVGASLVPVTVQLTEAAVDANPSETA